MQSFIFVTKSCPNTLAMVDCALQDEQSMEKSDSGAKSCPMSHQTTTTVITKNRRAKSVVFAEVDYGQHDGINQSAEGDKSRRPVFLACESSTKSMPSPFTRTPSIVRLPGFFASRKVAKGDIEKPWVEAKNRQREWGTILPLFGIIVGICLASGLVCLGVFSVSNHSYCEVLIENFDSPTLNSSVWTKEVQSGGFG